MEVRFPNVTTSGVELNEDQTLCLLAMAGYEERDGVWYDDNGNPMPIGMIDETWKAPRYPRKKKAVEYRGPVYEPWPEIDLIGEAESDVEAVAVLDNAPISAAHRYVSIAQDAVCARSNASATLRSREMPTELQRAASLLAGHYIRAANAGVASTLLPAEWLAILDLFGGRCTYCDRRSLRLTLDHVVALARGGPNTAANVVPACKSCNSSKNDDELLGWLARRGFDETSVLERIADARSLAVTS